MVPGHGSSTGLNQVFQKAADGTGSGGVNLSSSQYSATILNHLLQQQTAAQRAEAALHHRNLLTSMLPPQTKNELLATAVQQELVASLTNPNLQLLSSFNAGSGIVGRLLSSGEQDAMLHHISGAPPSQSLLNSLNAQKRIDLRAQSGRGDLEVSAGPCVSSVAQETATQLPCQARGMAADHNSSTAYFEIPNNATHGQHLLCSYPACRAAGVKFRYCLFCKKPVTKQNFRSRHLHADLEKPTYCSPISVEREKPTSVLTRNPRKRLSLANEPKNVNCKVPAEAKSPDIILDSFSNVSPARIMGENEEDCSIRTVTKTLDAPAPPKSPAVDDALRKVMRRRRWNSLLSERPVGFQNMDAWLAEVIAVSDTSKVFTPSASTFSVDGVSRKATADRIAQWGALLSERPAGSLAGDEVDVGVAVTTWLSKVLKVSCPDSSQEAARITAPREEQYSRISRVEGAAKKLGWGSRASHQTGSAFGTEERAVKKLKLTALEAVNQA